MSIVEATSARSAMTKARSMAWLGFDDAVVMIGPADANQGQLGHSAT